MTALGINNNGELIFPYGKEDVDYNIDGNPASGYVFNGATSVFWCRLRDLLPGEIKSTFQNVAAECFSAENLINEFDKYQECYPEEIWRLDIQRKYIRTFTGESVDNSKPKKDPNYLRDMMQGRKKYQRRQWVRDQEIYFGTKNLMNTVVGDNNRITFRCYTPTVDDIVIQPDYTLNITPYSDMYVSAMFGNGDTRQIRAKAGQQYELKFVPSTTDDTQVTIYGANRIQALNDLSACYLTTINISMADKLKKLVLGNATAGYSNPRLTALSLGNNRLLEELDIRNCKNLTGSINLAECNNLLKLYAEGTSLTGVIFSTNGKVQIAHLPDTVNTLTMRNLNNLVDFQATLKALETLTLQGGALNNQEVINSCIDTLQVLNLYDVDWTGSKSLADTTLLNKLYALFYSVITGKVYISGQVRNQELLNYEKWKDLEVSYNPTNLVTQYLVKYINADDKSTVLYTTYVDAGSTPPDPYAEGWIEKPTLESDAEYDYSFGTEVDGEYVSKSGWSDEINDQVLVDNKVITAKYTKNKRRYTVTWYSREGSSLGSVEADYGDDVVYSGETPTEKESAATYNVFAGWNNSTGFIKEDTDVYAIWETAQLPDKSLGLSLEKMTPGQIFAVTTSKGNDGITNAKSYFEDGDYVDITLGHDFDFENVESKVLVAEDKYFDGTDSIDTEINLFDENERSFTLAIDFRFIDLTADSTLLSCYKEDGSEGFRLRINSGTPNIQWGDANCNVGYQGYRDMVVLRHTKGDNNLYVYCSNGNTRTFADDIVETMLIRSRSIDDGQNLSLKLGECKGYIYWAKIWYDDLGATNARKLAAWTHEPVRVEYYGAGRYALAADDSQTCNASFIFHDLLSDRLRAMNPDSTTNEDGWSGSSMRTFLNNRLPLALPTVWRSMLKQVQVKTFKPNSSVTIKTTNDYFYLPSYTEMGGTTSSNEGDSIGWLGDNLSCRAYRIKNKGLLVSPGFETQYINKSDYNSTANYPESAHSGDRWVVYSTNNNGIGYIYATDDDVRRLGLPLNNKIETGTGYWLPTTSWVLRTPFANNTTNYYSIGMWGRVVSNAIATTACGVCPCFSI